MRVTQRIGRVEARPIVDDIEPQSAGIVVRQKAKPNNNPARPAVTIGVGEPFLQNAIERDAKG